MKKIATKFASFNNEKKRFYLDKSPINALDAGYSQSYYQILTDFDFITLKINHPNFGVEALIRDYDLINDPEILANLEETEKLQIEQLKTLKLIQGALRLSAHILNQDSEQLVGQLWGRLQGFLQPEIQKLLEDAQQSNSKIPRFRPITASLTTPDGNLIRTLTGHNDKVTAIAIAPDGKTALSGSDDNSLKLWNLDTSKEIATLTGHNKWVRDLQENKVPFILSVKSSHPMRVIPQMDTKISC